MNVEEQVVSLKSIAGEEERSIGQEASSDANAYSNIAAATVPLGSLSLAYLFGHFASSDGEILAAAAGLVIGLVITLQIYFRARSYSLDMKRRQIFMDRN